MNEANERSQDEQSWKQLYEAALLELDLHLLPQRIAEAQRAIGERSLALLRANGDNSSEQQALANAHVALDDANSSSGFASGNGDSGIWA